MTPFDLPRLDPGVELRLEALERRFEQRLDVLKRELSWEFESRLYGVIVAAVAVLSLLYMIWSWKAPHSRAPAQVENGAMFAKAIEADLGCVPAMGASDPRRELSSGTPRAARRAQGGA